jgi:RNA polymerase sigma-70 factor (ECF subfamily)
MQEALPDAALVTRARDGDRQAFSTLVQRHRGAVLRFARHLVTDAASAEDVLQETFITALHTLADFRGEGSVKAWLLAIARSKAWRQRRRRQGEPAKWEPVESLEQLASAAGYGVPLNPEELTSRVERQSLLEHALAQLAAEEREVVVLRDVEGLSGEETAAALGLTLAGMKSRLHRGRLHLVGALKQEGLS